MPFYEYECQACKYYTEVMQKISDAPLTKCPSCGKRKLTKLVSAPVFRLKGGGWYETDFKGEGENKRNLVGSDKEEGKSEAKPEGKPESKPDAKADAKEAKPAPKEPKPAAGKAVARKRPPARPARAKARKPAGRSRR
jgi:putative FmdB family regulatory protein